MRAGVEWIKMHVSSHCNSGKYNTLVGVVGRALEKVEKVDFETGILCD